MKITNKALIQDLVKRTKEHLNQVERYRQLRLEELNWKENKDKWSVLECIEHLNRYGDFYIPEITRRIQNQSPAATAPTFKSGWLGNYFAESRLPKEKLYKMNTFKSMNPSGSELDKEVLDKFIRQQKQLLEVLEKSSTLNLSKIKTAISISNWIKLRLGDTFRVLIYHNYRHMVQAEKILKQHKIAQVSAKT